MDSLLLQFRHVRDSSRKVKEEVYRVVADLIGWGLFPNESVQAIIVVGNGLFDRNWREQEKEKDTETRDVEKNPADDCSSESDELLVTAVAMDMSEEIKVVDTPVTKSTSRRKQKRR
jgi:hypothetical protein